MIGGIFETIGKTLGIGKEKYFLELDDAAEDVANKVQQAAASAIETAKDVSSDVADTLQSKADDAGSAANKAKANAKQTANKAADKAASKADKAASKADEAASEADKKAAKFNKKANKLIKEGDAKVKVSANQESGKIEATAIETDQGKDPAKKSAQQVIANKTPETSAPQASRDPEDIIREALAKVEKKPSGKPVDPEAAETFSTDYLMPLGNRGRRRPGPSFSNYKNMARDTNPRLKS